MSLVHESLIDVLNRRFVNCHYNAFSGIGSDAQAREFCAGKNIGYGGILTPEGELLVAFGYDRQQFYQALTKVLASDSKYVRMTEAEQAVLAKAQAEPRNAAAQRSAARLQAELLRFDDAQQSLARALKAETDKTARAAIRFWQVHYRLLAAELETRTVRNTGALKDREQFRTDLAAIKHLPEDLQDDRALDLISLDVELTPQRGFFTGWRFRPGADLKRASKELRQWIQQAPRSNRIGQMHFYLGLVYAAYDDLEQADDVWERHFKKYPDDRFAMLSRLHHTAYQFSPYNVGGQSVIIGGKK